MSRLWYILSRPGARQEVAGLAPTQTMAPQYINVAGAANTEPVESRETGYRVKPKQRMLDRWLDAFVRLSGSEPVFLVILAGLFGWAFAGIKLHGDIDWEVSISDVQAILSYLFDSLLMRQQLNGYDEGLLVSAQLRSRAHTHLRMLQQIARDADSSQSLQALEPAKIPDASNFDLKLPKENWLGRLTTTVANVLGNIVLVIVYWATIVVWLAFGPSNGWNNWWQLYCNSATSALMIFVFAFLANIRERHSQHAAECLDATYEVDSAIERKLRQLTGDNQTNEYYIVPAPQVNWLQRAIFYYADVVGTLVGVVLLIIVIVIWIAIGPLLKFNTNWWLLIGTYAGLVGLNDGFVLRNVQAQLREHETTEFNSVMSLDEQLFATIRTPAPPRIVLPGMTLSDKVSIAVGRFTAHPITVLLGVLLIVGLLVGSSIMGWNTTGQLLCNVPPSIIESFLMIVLITGHNFADAERRVLLSNLYQRRLSLIALVENIVQMGKMQSGPERGDVEHNAKEGN